MEIPRRHPSIGARWLTLSRLALVWQMHQIVMEVVDKTVSLVQDPFGNYVVQYVLEQVPAYRPNIVGIIAMSIVELSRQKFSSNVVEKCLQLAAPKGQAMMVTQLAQKEHILQLLQVRIGWRIED